MYIVKIKSTGLFIGAFKYLVDVNIFMDGSGSGRDYFTYERVTDVALFDALDKYQ